MHLIADENLPELLIRLLRLAGINVHSIRETNPGFSDTFILDEFRNTGHVVITYDNDFSELLSRNPYGITIFLLKSQGDDVAKLSAVIRDYLKMVTLLPNSVYVFELGKPIRVRQFTY